MAYSFRLRASRTSILNKGLAFKCAVFAMSDLAGCNAREASFVKADCRGTNFSMARLDGADMQFTDCSPMQIASNINSSKSIQWPTNFSGCNLQGVLLKGANLSGAQVRECYPCRCRSSRYKSRRNNFPGCRPHRRRSPRRGARQGRHARRGRHALIFLHVAIPAFKKMRGYAIKRACPSPESSLMSRIVSLSKRRGFIYPASGDLRWP